MFEADFFSPSPASRESYRAAVAGVADMLARALPRRACPGGTPAELAAALPAWPPSGPMPLPGAIESLGRVVAGSVAVHHPHTAAHLHCPVLIPGLAAEMALTAALNQTIDSFDQFTYLFVLDLESVLAIAFGALLFEETCSWGKLSGVALIVAGIFLLHVAEA
jgi:L-2,4-diaminobutyrate decarboxylase